MLGRRRRCGGFRGVELPATFLGPALAGDAKLQFPMLEEFAH